MINKILLVLISILLPSLTYGAIIDLECTIDASIKNDDLFNGFDKENKGNEEFIKKNTRQNKLSFTINNTNNSVSIDTVVMPYLMVGKYAAKILPDQISIYGYCGIECKSTSVVALYSVNRSNGAITGSIYVADKNGNLIGDAAFDPSDIKNNVSYRLNGQCRSVKKQF